MQNTTKRNKRILYTILAIAAVFFFNIIYFDPTSSINMVNKGLNILLRAVSIAAFLPSLMMGMRHKFEEKYKIALVVVVLTFLGTIILPLFDTTASGFMIYGLFIIGLFTVYFWAYRTMSVVKASALIIAAGCVMRVGFGMAVPTSLDAHDFIFSDSFANSYGHASYIGYIAENWSLPLDYTSQNYHPPLHHFIGALYYHLTQILGFSFSRFAESFQFVTALYSCLSLYVWHRIFKEFFLEKAIILLPLAVMAFHPAGWLMGACLNNDMLMWLLAGVCLLYLIRWYRKPTYKNIIIMALTLGLAMMTKTSAVLIAPAIAFILIFKLIKGNHGKKYYISQCAVFAAISIPLGTWYQIRNLVQFYQPLSYVPSLSLTSTQNIGHLPFLSRLFGISLDLFSSPFVIWDGVDYNFIIKVLKTALFGETKWLMDFDYYGILAGFLTLINYALVLVSIFAIFYILYSLRKSKSLAIYSALAIYYFTLTTSHIYFSYLYPFQCTNDMRYSTANIWIGLLFIGKLIQRMRFNRFQKKVKKENIPKISPVAVCFCVLSCLIYVLDSFYRVF